AGNLDDAVGKAHVIAQVNPGVPLAHVIEGDVLLAKGDYRQAVAAYGYANSIAQSEPSVLRLVYALIRAGDMHGAARVVAQFHTDNPTNLAGLELTADLASDNAQWNSAIAALEQIRARLGNSDANLLSSLGWAWYGRGDVPRALRYARAAYALQPENSDVANSYGWILFQSGSDQAGGIALLEKAASLSRDRVGLRVQLAQAYSALGRKVAARAMLAPIAANPKAEEHDVAVKLLSHL
ncbi:MAG: tetratricopeptide repeat protein, partial [Alphaproteobacteria bacterium]|nr:tetratricopeptide repeat protein [Alphaproteobacteria bacterium]